LFHLWIPEEYEKVFNNNLSKYAINVKWYHIKSWHINLMYRFDLIAKYAQTCDTQNLLIRIDKLVIFEENFEFKVC
jgi:hypothetical protein